MKKAQIVEKLDAAAKSGVSIESLVEAACSRGVSWNGHDAFEFRDRQIRRSRPLNLDPWAEVRGLVDRIESKVARRLEPVNVEQQLLAEAKDVLTRSREGLLLAAMHTPGRAEEPTPDPPPDYPYGVRRAWIAGRVITIPCHTHQEKYLPGWSSE